MRPVIGAVIVAYCSCTLAFSTAARSASTVAFSAATVVRDVSTCSRGGDAALASSLKALGLRGGVGGLRHVAVEVRLRLLQRRFERTAVEREQDLPVRDVVAFGEVDAGQLARGLRADGDGRERLGRADDADFDRHRLLDHGADRDGYRGTASSAATSPPVTGARRGGGALLAGTTGADQKPQNTGNNEGSGSHDEISVRWLWADFSRTAFVMD